MNQPTDEELLAIRRSLPMEADHVAFARAVLAMKNKPLSAEQIQAGRLEWINSAYNKYPMPFEAGVKFAEFWHGIGSEE